MTRRLITSFVLATLLGANAAPLVASVRHCAMQRPAPSGSCTRCDVAGGPAHEASVSAGSCCRFEAATPRTQAPGVVPSQLRPEDTGSTLAVLSASQEFGAPALERTGSDPSPPRSTDSPLSLRTTLRL